MIYHHLLLPLLRSGLEDKYDRCKTLLRQKKQLLVLAEPAAGNILVATVTGVTMSQANAENTETCVTHRIPVTTELSTKISILRDTHLKRKGTITIKFREDAFIF
jgi:ABC-type uncharacterized transport system ATPase subunit